MEKRSNKNVLMHKEMLYTWVEVITCTTNPVVGQKPKKAKEGSGE